uniref:ATP synthase complex subunit 8 n=1 Tax=Mullus surmuletus TaxID=87757 RepID=A0A7G9M2W1_MULSU|nr:ATP synthase F0 subunit 8 [Mullus surmuletus]QNM99679.1 ATP synthase F0 subunit 8 [Mullus surmuletus]
MPQLNPTPWLPIFVLTWTILLTIVPPKVLAHTLPNDPTAQSAETPKTDPWDWSCP